MSYPARPATERFWEKVFKKPGRNSCWEWEAARLPTGYGRFMKTKGFIVYAHRWSWEAAFGPIPDGMYVCHSCDNPSCVRPSHLFLGDAMDNKRDSVSKGRARGRFSYA
jgi:hypothetical protein